VTVELAPTTWTLVRIVSGAVKKPLPKPLGVSTRTTAGIARLITSSSPAGGAGAGSVVATAVASVRFEAAAAAITRSSAVGSGVAGTSGEAEGFWAVAGAGGAAVTAGDGAIAVPAARETSGVTGLRVNQ
jgi:hypothetical protein